MDEVSIRRLLEGVQNGQTNISDAVAQLKALPYEDVNSFARLDHHRALRCGFPEVVYGQGKTLEQLIMIITRLSEQNEKVMVTRLNADTYALLQEKIPPSIYYPIARILVVDRSNKSLGVPGVMVITAGTVDIPVAEEAALTAELMGNSVERLFDVGVAGIHRLLSHVEVIQKARVLVVVAGMDGALPSVVGGLVAAPVIAVPTSAGYGANFQGLAPLLTMLNSCANGIAVVNIDNGFGAGYLAGTINLMGK
jgi:pyridinium-3,5-biscarboxylic acid mononucleotide synthase